MTTLLILWHTFVTMSILIIFLYMLRVWLHVRALKTEISLANQLLVAWAKTWGMPHEVVRDSLEQVTENHK